MASEFIGCTVLVTLKTPPNCRVEGEVIDVVGTRLSLKNAHLLWNGQHFPLYHIDGSRIADLEISSEPTPQPSTHPRSGPVDSSGYHPSQHGQQQHPTVSTQPESMSRNTVPPSFVDPAILSFKRPSTQDGRLATPNEVEPATIISHPVSTSPVMLGGSEVPTSAHTNQMGHHSRLPATLNAPFSDLELNKQEFLPSTREGIVEEQELEQNAIPRNGRPGGNSSTAAQLKHVGKRGKRSGKRKPEKDGGETTDITATELHVSAINHGKKGTAGKGWRQTAFIEPIDTSTTAKKSQLRSSRKSRAHKEDLNGWATEDATDIQELGDFDFQSNLSKFDKRRVFDEIRNDDMTPLEDRLASFNRRPKPGTNGGKNLHYTENVLDSAPQPQTSQWNSEAGETDDDYTANGRTSSRNRSMPSRKGSGVLASTPSSAQFTILGRPHLSSTRTTSPQPIKTMKHSASSITGSSGSSAGALHMITTGRRCPSISPLQMVEIEQLAISELGLTEDIVTENAGRGIAEGAISLATGLRVPSIIIVFVGNHRTGARTVASARHLRNRGYRVSLCILGNDRDNEFTDGFQKQVDIFQKAGGHVMRWEDLSSRLSTGDYMPKLVIDALLIISWVNRSNVDVLSVDIPSGLSATTGEATISQGSQLAISSQFVICLGAPKTGLVTALSLREGESWQIAVADVGISPVAWRKYGTRRRHGVEFGSAWVVPLRFQLPTP